MIDPEDGDSESKFHDVTALLDGWSPGPNDRRFEVSRGVREMLDRGLNTDASSRWHRDIVERQRGALSADVTVNGEIAIVILGSARAAAVSAIHSRLILLGHHYNYLVVYWRDAARDDVDARRLLERRTTVRSLGVEGVSFVGAGSSEPVDPKDDDSFPVPKRTVASVVVLLVAISLGLYLSAPSIAHGIDVIGGFPPLARAFVLGSGLLFVVTLGFAVFLGR